MALKGKKGFTPIAIVDIDGKPLGSTAPDGMSFVAATMTVPVGA